MIQIVVTGNVVANAETKTILQGTKVTKFCVASNRKVKGENKATFFNVDLFGERGDKVAQYITKGKQVTVAGEFSVREYTKKDGNAGTSLDIRCNDVALHGGGEQRGDAAEPVGGGDADFQVMLGIRAAPGA